MSLSCIGKKIGISVDSVQRLLVESSKRLRQELEPREEPFMVVGDSVSAHGIAGVIRLAPGVEIEIVPKCFAPVSPGWHDDFLVMAAVTKFGRIFRREQISAGLRAEHRGVLTLLAVAFLEEFERLSRVPIRQYRRSFWTSPNIDGELDYAEVWAARPEGFLQAGSVLSAENQFMGVISATAAYLGSESADRGIGQGLLRLAKAFPNVVSRKILKKVPGHYARWQHLYDLAISIRAGHGMQLGSDDGLNAPGFVLNTEKGWEALLTFALIAQGKDFGARKKPRSKLGTRYPSMGDVVTYPDLVLNPPSFEEPIVVDAKYKGTATKRVERISADDLYEALAFLTAQRSRVAILLYPGGDFSSLEVEPGTLVTFDEILIDSKRIIGARVNTYGIGRSRGLAEFGRRLGQCLLKVARQDRVSVA